MPRSLREQIAERCVHFTGVGRDDACKAGVPYSSWGPPYLKLPCLRKDGVEYLCPLAQFPTEAQVAAKLVEQEAHSAKLMAALAVVGPVKKAHKGKNWAGEVPCPVCGGKLHLTHAALNGHVWGKCETPDCVAWIE